MLHTLFLLVIYNLHWTLLLYSFPTGNFLNQDFQMLKQLFPKLLKEFFLVLDDLNFFPKRWPLEF